MNAKRREGFTDRTADREQTTDTRKDNEHCFIKDTCKLCCSKSFTYCTQAFAKERYKSRMSGCYQKCKLKYVKDVFCVDQLSFVKSETNMQHAASNLPVGARLQNFWQTWLDLKVVQILREGYSLSFQIRPNLTRSPTIISCYVNPHWNLYLLEALHYLMDINAVELVQNKKYLGFFNRIFLVPKPNNHWRPILDLSKLNLFLKMETPWKPSGPPSSKGSGLPQ